MRLSALSAKDGYPKNRDGIIKMLSKIAERHGTLINTSNGPDIGDYWRNPVHFKDEDRAILVWSSGPNGIDENGQGDDQIYTIPK